MILQDPKRSCNGSSLYNSSVELGTRLAFLLTSLSDRSLDLDQLVFFDYALLYSGEFNGPSNLHPPVPNHIAEIIHRREYLPSALKLFISRGLIGTQITSHGYYYFANENTSHYVRCLRSTYYEKMWANLYWLEENFQALDQKRLNVINDSL